MSHTPYAPVHMATSLSDLCDALTAADAETREHESIADVYSRLGITIEDLPTFGGEVPGDTAGIFSWDETHLLLPGFNAGEPWRTVPRPTEE